MNFCLWKNRILPGLAGAALIGIAVAQLEPQQPSPVEPKKTIPEKIAPPQKRVPDRERSEPDASNSQHSETLGEKLGRTHGVIHPPKDIDPGVEVPAPVPDPGTTRVIPPPGSPGNPSPIRPK